MPTEQLDHEGMTDSAVVGPPRPSTPSPYDQKQSLHIAINADQPVTDFSDLSLTPTQRPHSKPRPSPPPAFPKPSSLTLQDLATLFTQELDFMKRSTAAASASDHRKGTTWFRLCMSAFDLLECLGIDNDTALKLSAVRHLVLAKNSMKEVVEHLLPNQVSVSDREKEEMVREAMDFVGERECSDEGFEKSGDDYSTLNGVTFEGTK